MATATAAQRRDVKEYLFVWEGFDRNNRQVRGETRAASETVVTTNLRRQGIRDAKVRTLRTIYENRVGEGEGEDHRVRGDVAAGVVADQQHGAFRWDSLEAAHVRAACVGLSVE